MDPGCEGKTTPAALPRTREEGEEQEEQHRQELQQREHNVAGCSGLILLPVGLALALSTWCKAPAKLRPEHVGRHATTSVV